MVHLIATSKSSTSLQTAHLFISNVVRLHGLPRSIHSDRDRRFMSHFWISLCEILDIKQCASSAYHPQSNGQAERTNQTVEQLLRQCFSTSKIWDQSLPLIEMAINAKPLKDTECSPFYLNYGHHPFLPSDFLTGSVSDFSTVSEDALTFTNRLMNDFTTWSHLQPSSVPSVPHPSKFNVDDSVLISVRKRPLLQPHAKGSLYVGPFRVIEVVSPESFRLALPPSFKNMHNVFHVSHLRPYLTSVQFSDPPAITIPDSDPSALSFSNSSPPSTDQSFPDTDSDSDSDSDSTPIAFRLPSHVDKNDVMLDLLFLNLLVLPFIIALVLIFLHLNYITKSIFIFPRLPTLMLMVEMP